MKLSQLNDIDPTDIIKTYRGGIGCACGCLGDYQRVEENLQEVTKHTKYIKARLSKAEFGGNYVEVENPSGTGVTRAYFKPSVFYYRTQFGCIDRVEATDGVNPR